MASRAGGTKTVFDKQAILRGHPLFGQLGAETLSRLASYSHTRSFAAGTRIFEKGDPGSSLFAVCGGTVKISNQSIGGKDAVFNLISAGGIFGEIALRCTPIISPIDEMNRGKRQYPANLQDGCEK